MVSEMRQRMGRESLILIIIKGSQISTVWSSKKLSVWSSRSQIKSIKRVIWWFSQPMAAMGRQLKQSVKVFHSLMLYRRLPESTKMLNYFVFLFALVSLGGCGPWGCIFCVMISTTQLHQGRNLLMDLFLFRSRCWTLFAFMMQIDLGKGLSS